MNLSASHWQCPMDVSSYEMCCKIVPQRTWSSIRVLHHRLKNALESLHMTASSLFQEIQSNFKSWVDNFILCTKTLSEVSNIIDNF